MNDINKDYVKEVKRTQKMGQDLIIKGFIDLSKSMSPEHAFESIMYGVVDLCLNIKKHQPEFWDSFSKDILPHIYSILVSKNTETTIKVIKEMMDEKFQKKGIKI